MFDGSSIAGWKGINESDMILMPDDSTSVLDPFTDDTTVILRCDIVEPSTMQGYERDPRSVARAPRSTSSPRASVTRRTSDRSPSSSSLTTSSGMPT
jgi:glutamine synthetase